jgi:hypothetical protein
MPSSAVRAVASSPTTVSTMPSGRPPIAATSLTLVSTAAIPAPYGSARTNGGNSLAAGDDRVAVGVQSRAVVAGAVEPAVVAEDVGHQADRALGGDRRIAPDCRKRPRPDQS